MSMRVRFPLLLKKLGGRRTGSRALARAGELLYHAMFVVAGLVGCWWLVTDVLIPEWRLAERYERYLQTRGVVVDSDVESRPGLAEKEFCPVVQVRFSPAPHVEVLTWTRHGVGRDVPSAREAQAALKSYPAGVELDVWYDPDDPESITLNTSRRYLPWLILCIPVSLVVAGVVGLVQARSGVQATPERRSDRLLGGDAAWVSGETGTRQLLASGLPPLDEVGDSPGVLLEYRLPMDGAEGWRLFGMATLCVLWNALAAVFVFQFTSGTLPIGWSLVVVVLVITPLAVTGAWLVRSVWRDARSVGGVGVTQAEIARHPLSPGVRTRGVLLHSGRLKLRLLTVSLLCEEIATFRQGTDTRTAVVEVCRNMLLRERFVRATPGEPLRCEFEFAIPEEAPHSFVSPHNEVRWSLEVAVGVARMTEVRRRFRLCVYPSAWGRLGNDLSATVQAVAVESNA